MRQFFVERWKFWCASKVGVPPTALRAEFAASVMCLLGVIFFVVEVLYMHAIDDTKLNLFGWAPLYLFREDASASFPPSLFGIFVFGYCLLIPILFICGIAPQIKRGGVRRLAWLLACLAVVCVVAVACFLLYFAYKDDPIFFFGNGSEIINFASFLIFMVSCWYFARFNLFNLFWSRFLFRKQEVTGESKWDMGDSRPLNLIDGFYGAFFFLGVVGFMFRVAIT